MATPVHSGSWFGLPDFGITEAVGGLFGAPRTAQGGSNIFGSAQKAASPTQTSTPNYLTVNSIPKPTGGAGTSYSGGGGSVLGTSTAAPTQSGPDYAGQARDAINSGYNQYFGQLDDILNNGLPQQRAAQEGIVNSQYNQGVNDLTTQKNLGVQDLNSERTKATGQQAKTLQDLSDNIRNLFTSGNVYLGAKGAGDSSAANQYSYALTKLGSQQRGDVTSQYANINNDINGRESRLNEIYNGQVNDLGSQRDQQINGIAQWFGEQQNALKQAKAQGQLSQGQDLGQLSQQLLNQALQQLSNVQAEAAQKRASLDQWAMNHASDINSLRSNLSQVSDTNYSMPTASPVNGMPATAGGGGNPSLFGYGSSEKQKTNIFGQPIQ
jgi:hypothetical protein